MPHPQSARRITLLALASCLLALTALFLVALRTGAAHAATGYGELTRFGKAGGAAGDIEPGLSQAIGVDTANNDVFVLDEEGEPKEVGQNLVHKYRLQELTEAGTFVASAKFTEKGPLPGVEAEEHPAQGLAVDPGLERVYVLADDSRGEFPGPKDAEARVASTLYAFSTKASGKTLPAASETTEGVLTGPGEAAGEFGAQSETAGRALLDPEGITVDPATHEVLILAHIDEKGEAVDTISNTTDHYVLQRVESDGKLGEKYVDSTNVLKPVSEGASPPTPDSPIVTSTSPERIYVDYNEGLVEIPYKAAGAPKPITHETAASEAENLTADAEGGGALSASPEGTIFGLAQIENERVLGNAVKPGVILSSATSPAKEIGWSGGQSAQAPQQKEEKCVLEPGVLEEPRPAVAAGREGKVFVLAGEFLTQTSGTTAAVIEFGPGGTGCPEASVAEPEAEASGKKLAADQIIPQHTAVTLSSRVAQADALKSEWAFSDPTTKETEATEVNPADQGLTARTTHKFEHEGEWTVTETITSDNFAMPAQTIFNGTSFASPLITEDEHSEKLTFNLKIEPAPASASFSGPTAVTLGEAAEFNASSSKGFGGGHITKYAWSFGDGSEETSISPIAKHVYGATGSYQVSLTITDAHGSTKSAPRTIQVHAPSAPSGGGGAPPPPPPPPGPGAGSTGRGGVLSYQVSVASTSISVNSKGALVITVKCLGQSSCDGAVTLRTASAVASGAGKHKAILTLASGSFTLAGGHFKALTLHLSSKAKALLVHSHTLRARATIVARDSAGAAHTTQSIVTLRATKAKHH